jgi:hypothetical protein
MHSVQRPSSHCGHQTSDGLEIWRISHIPQKDGGLDMMLISCNILLVEGLCTECIEHHSLVKLSRNHTTIPIEEYQKLPSYVLEIKEHCDEHHEKFDLYCKESTFINFFHFCKPLNLINQN